MMHMDQKMKIYQAFKKKFDVVGIIRTNRYLEAAKHMHKDVPHVNYPTMVVLGLAYPRRHIPHTETHFVPSFYTFGKDYHLILKQRIHEVMATLDMPYELGVDNHPHNERLAATLSGVGYFGKNQLIINKDFGTYMFLGVVFIDVNLQDEVILTIDDDCGTCRICIDRCPTSALSETGFEFTKCMSHYNQEKKVLSMDETLNNYSLFGCDICQMVCPKNIGKGQKVHPEFELSGKEMVSIVDLMTKSEKEFKQIYDEMAYLWKGKTILMRNAVALIYKKKMTSYIPLIESSIHKTQAPWYIEYAASILEALKDEKKE